MKRVPLFLYCSIAAVILGCGLSCSKELPATAGNTSGIVNPPPPNRPPIVIAGVDFTGILYSNDIVLKGYAHDQDMGNTVSTTWTQITGPACTIVSPQSLTTTVANLIVGDYQFELLAIDNYGATNRDTVVIKINSIQPISSPIDIFNLSWTCPMGCSIPIYNVYRHLPSNTPIRVFFKPVNTAVWLETIPISQYPSSSSIYYYSIDVNNTILIYTETDMIGNADVRIMF
jgi:hypothetical protein